MAISQSIRQKTTKRRRGAVNNSRVLAKKRRSKQLFMVLLIWIAVVGFVILGVQNAKKMFELDVQSVRINSGFKNTHREQLASVVAPFLNTGFFALDIANIKRQLEKEEWVYRAQVQRHWPAALGVNIVEQVPIAIWNGSALLNADGDAFARNYTAINRLALPRLAGAEGQQASMVQRYQEFSRMLEPMDYKLVELRHDDVQGLSAVLDNGIDIRFGNDELVEKMRQFLMLHKRLKGSQVEELAYIDFRYQHGAALRWNTSSDQGEEAEKKDLASLQGELAP